MLTNMTLLRPEQSPILIRPDLRVIPRKLQCVLLDDCDYDRQNFIALCRSTRFELEFRETANAAETQSELSDHLPDLLFLDYWVPDATGIELACEINTIYGANAPPAILITGDVDESIARASAEAGLPAVVGKTRLTAATIEAAIQTAIGKRSRQASDDLARQRRAQLQMVHCP